MRYIGPIHAIGLMFREEGMRGLYRGYTAYLLATTLYVCLVPLFAEMSVRKTRQAGNYDDTDRQNLVTYLKDQQNEKAK